MNPNELRKAYGIGTKAFFDSMRGLIPCTVTNIMSKGKVEVTVDETWGPWQAGDVITTRQFWAPPRECVRFPDQGMPRIMATYVYTWGAR